ncbi:hypothetical protein R6Q57_009858 [Mikania cordata]
MEKKSWVCTVIIQLVLCFALYCAINMGEPQTPAYRNRIRHRISEIYFISVRGGFRPVKQQTRLLNQIENMMYAYEVRFVINISELGEDDPLSQHIIIVHLLKRFGSLVNSKCRYTTIALNGDGPDYFLKQFNISSGRTFAIIDLNTGKIQDSSSGIDEHQLKQLSRKLELSNSNWHIATASHALFCNQSLEQTKRNDFLHQMLLKHGVDAYLTGQSCDNEALIQGPYLTTISQGSYPPKEMVNMFLLHRVSPLEITTYGVGFKGDIVLQSTIRQRGSAAM